MAGMRETSQKGYERTPNRPRIQSQLSRSRLRRGRSERVQLCTARPMQGMGEDGGCRAEAGGRLLFETQEVPHRDPPTGDREYSPPPGGSRGT